MVSIITRSVALFLIVLIFTNNLYSNFDGYLLLPLARLSRLVSSPLFVKNFEIYRQRLLYILPFNGLPSPSNIRQI